MELRFNGLKLIIIRHLSKRKAPWSESRGPDSFRSQSRRLRLAATGRSSGGGLFHEFDDGCFGAGFGDYFDNQSLSDAEPPEYLSEQFVGGDFTKDGAEAGDGGAQVLGQKVAGEVAGEGVGGAGKVF